MDVALAEFMKTWEVTPGKIEEAVRRLVVEANPLRVMLFGSRARGDHRADSDVDLAVLIDPSEDLARERVNASIFRGLRLEVTLIVVTEPEFEQRRHWFNSVYRAIDQEGIVLYDKSR